MGFRWSMNNDDFEQMQNDLASDEWKWNNCYRGVAVGSMLWEFVMETNDNNENVLVVNVFEAGVDDGYSSLDDGTPYDCIDHYLGTSLGLITTGSFEDFKESVLHAIYTLSCDDKHMLKMIESSMKPKWKGFEPELIYEIKYTRKDGSVGAYCGDSKAAYKTELNFCNKRNYVYTATVKRKEA